MSAGSMTSAGIERQSLSPEIEQKYQHLRAILAEMPSVLVAYSGGVDSALLLKVASDVLGERALGVIATSPAYEDAETAEALRNAETMGAHVIQIETHEMENERYVANGLDRCYHCKTELFTRLSPLAQERGIALIAYGLNRDDLGDFRPGQRAAREFGVRAPLQEADLGKEEIRAIAHYLGVPVWDKPALACFSSRIPYGMPVTVEALQKIGRAERLLRTLGFAQVRVRHHDTIARIEVSRADFPRLIEEETNRQVVAGLKAIGYAYVTLDLQGYRTGSMNELHRKRPDQNLKVTQATKQ
ncbi:MAG TPA: ATP-dependent sacrificial sulfur transferase LarE [Ktedonobacterales bacterium]